jgi:V-type H+-transporting ATPase subunit A
MPLWTGRGKAWQFKPCNFSEGQTITGGSIFGTVFENELMPCHSIMLPPDLYGTVVRTYGDGTDGKESFTLNDTVLEIEHGDSGEIIPVRMSHFW